MSDGKCYIGTAGMFLSNKKKSELKNNEMNCLAIYLPEMYQNPGFCYSTRRNDDYEKEVREGNQAAGQKSHLQGHVGV